MVGELDIIVDSALLLFQFIATSSFSIIYGCCNICNVFRCIVSAMCLESGNHMATHVVSLLNKLCTGFWF